MDGGVEGVCELCPWGGEADLGATCVRPGRAQAAERSAHAAHAPPAALAWRMRITIFSSMRCRGTIELMAMPPVFLRLR